MIDFSVIIPVFRGENTIEELYVKLKSFFERYNFSYEVIFVWDGGTQESLLIMNELVKIFPKTVKAIQLTRNFGQHNAIIAGIEESTGKFVITMDEDLQHEPQDIKLLIEQQQKNDLDLVYGNYIEREHNGFRNITSLLMKKLLSWAIPELHKDYSAFRLIKKDVAKHTILMQNSYTFIDGYLAWITSNVGSVEVKHHLSKAGQSSYNLSKLINHSLNIFFTFSDLPVRIFTYLSMFIFTVSIFYSAYILLRKIIYDDFISGFATFAVILGFGIGSILFGLGIIGEYLHRVNMKTTKRPNYLKKDREA